MFLLKCYAVLKLCCYGELTCNCFSQYRSLLGSQHNFNLTKTKAHCPPLPPYATELALLPAASLRSLESRQWSRELLQGRWRWWPLAALLCPAGPCPHRSRNSRSTLGLPTDPSSWDAVNRSASEFKSRHWIFICCLLKTAVKSVSRSSSRTITGMPLGTTVLKKIPQDTKVF